MVRHLLQDDLQLLKAGIHGAPATGWMANKEENGLGFSGRRLIFVMVLPIERFLLSAF